nr:reverse transcriptase domain-containing protein [Tanacetum cinerariifolium]
MSCETFLILETVVDKFMIRFGVNVALDSGFPLNLNAEQADWKDDTDDDELEDQELKVHYMYMAQLQQVSSDAADSGPIFDDEPLQKNDDDNDLAKERELLASLIEKLKCEIDESKNRNKFLETSNKALIEKLKGEIEEFKNKNKSLESSNNFFKEANNRLSETNNLLYTDYKKSEAELARHNSKERVVPRNYNPKGERFLIASRFPTPPLACAFFSLRATETSSSKLALDQTSNPTSSANPTPKGQIRRSSKQKVDNSHFEEHLTPVVTMTDNRTMAEMLRTPTEGCAEAIVVPLILAKQFELKHSLINMMTSEQFFGLEKDNPHDHIRAARQWLEKEPSHSITTWDDLVSKFINEFFPPHELRTFVMKSQSFSKNSMNLFARHGKDIKISFVHQDSLNAAAGGNLLEKSPQDALTIIENKSKDRNSRSKPIASSVNACDNHSSSELAKLTHAVNQQTSVVTTIMTAMLKQFQSNPPPAQGTLPGNTIANTKGELKAITTCSGLVTDRPTVPNPPKSINPEEDKCVEETYTDPDLAKYTINVPPPPQVQKPKPPVQRNFVLHTRDSLPHIIYPLRMLKQKQQEKDDIHIQKFWNMFKQLHLNITLAEALVLMPKYQKMLKALLSNKEKLQELANTPLNENCSAVILKKLPEKLGDPGKFLIPCGFSELKCKALANLGASINLMPLSVWKKLGLPDLIPTQMTQELANRAICTPDGIARDVFVPVEVILREGDERLTLNMKHDIASYSNHPRRDSVNLINIFNISSEDCLEDLVSNKQSGNPTFSLHKEMASSEVTHEIHDSKGCTFLSEELPDIYSFNDIHPHFDDDPLSGSTTYSANSLLEEFTDELSLITYPLDYDDNRTCDIESNLREIEFLLYQGEDSDFKDSIDQSDLTNRDDLFVDPTLEMFADEQPPNYSFPPRFDVYPDDFLEIESDADNFDDDSFDSKGEKIKEFELLIDQLDLPCDILSEYDSSNSQNFSRDDDLPSPDNEDKVFNPGILIHEKSVSIITRVAQEKKLAISYASLFEDFDPLFFELLVFKKVPISMRLLPFLSKNEEKVFKPGIYTSKKVKEYQEKDKIESKPNKNRKRGEAGKSQKQLQWNKQEKLKKTQKEGPEMQTHAKFY